MRINAVGVASSDIHRTIEFYTILGFEFEEVSEGEDHVEPKARPGGARLMIDSKKLLTEQMGQEPKPGNHSSFAIEYDKPTEVNEIAAKLINAGFDVELEPWDAFWGQRYCVVKDPDGYLVDLYARL